MGFFSAKRVPNTISDKQWGSLRRRAEREQGRHHLGMFSDKAVRQRKASNRQHERRGWS